MDLDIKITAVRPLPHDFRAPDAPRSNPWRVEGVVVGPEDHPRLGERVCWVRAGHPPAATDVVSRAEERCEAIDQADSADAATPDAEAAP